MTEFLNKNINLLSDFHKEIFKNSLPFEHIVFDDFFETNHVDNLIEFTKNIKKWRDTHVYGSKKHIENRLVADYSEINGILKNTINFFYSDFVVDFVSSILGLKIEKQQAWRGGGLQKSTNGAFLDIHLDNSWHPEIKCWSVANCIYYLSSDWDESFGGDLELWNKNECVKKISPIRNRCVFTINNDVSYHGYSNMMNLPQDRFRQSLVLFYYSKYPNQKSSKREKAEWL